MGSFSDQCYTCVHRRSLPHSAHSACVHPATHAVQRDPYMALVGLVGKRGGAALVVLAQTYGISPSRAMDELQIVGARPGLEGGWFFWPVNFDPVWLEHCAGFTAIAGGAP